MELAHQLEAIVGARGAQLRAAAPFAPHAYTRTLVERTAIGELWLLGWLPGQATEIHDHGGVASASIVLAGSLHEEQFRIVAPGTVAFAGAATQTAGAIDIVEQDHVHRVCAAVQTVSLHLYAGSCANRFYALAPRALERVA